MDTTTFDGQSTLLCLLGEPSSLSAADGGRRRATAPVANPQMHQVTRTVWPPGPPRASSG